LKIAAKPDVGSRDEADLAVLEAPTDLRRVVRRSVICYEDLDVCKRLGDDTPERIRKKASIVVVENQRGNGRIAHEGL
jgi:hypothetical protein